MWAAVVGSVTFAAWSRKQTCPASLRNRTTAEPVAFGSLDPFRSIAIVVPAIAAVVPVSWPRIAPAGNSAVWTFT